MCVDVDLHPFRFYANIRLVTHWAREMNGKLPKTSCTHFLYNFRHKTVVFYTTFRLSPQPGTYVAAADGRRLVNSDWDLNK